ncbi:hypothetical protein PULV_a3998 [Pseudoalteromonas ulvae UL12]|uniref:hypothetical protein n=1 Tax=Pseudoalteromonas ulvae TaxID=107327 RepID=UPI00186B77EC|nr:hypothetical protein [Pseudoalteromonas ulvae]MBE0362187.1 hypothetical protein [Pseudoalteromonas ulvae UL12]
MLISNRDLAFAVLGYIRDIDAYLLGEHEVEFSRLIKTLPYRSDVSANRISKLISDSPLSRYRFKLLKMNKVVGEWKPFVSEQTFNSIRDNFNVEVSYMGDSGCVTNQNIMAFNCVNWCRKYVVRGVNSDIQGLVNVVG